MQRYHPCGAPLDNPATPVNLQAAGNGTSVFYTNSPVKVGLSFGIDGNLYYVSYGVNTGKALMISYNGPATGYRAPSGNDLTIRNSAFRLGGVSDINITLNGAVSLRAAGEAEFSVLDGEGRTRFRQQVDMAGNSLRAQGFRPTAAGLYVCRLSWKADGAERQALGRLVVLP